MNKGLIINEDIWGMIDDLEDEEKAELLTALSAYYNGTEIPELSRVVMMVFKRIALDNVRFDPEHRQSITSFRSEAGKKGAAKRWQIIANDGKNSKNGKLLQEKIREDKKRIDYSACAREMFVKSVKEGL